MVIVGIKTLGNVGGIGRVAKDMDEQKRGESK